MSPPNRYLVSPDAESWKVTNEGGATISRHRTQATSIRVAINVADSNPPSQVLVTHPDGQIRTEWTHGHDPYPPAG